MTLINTAWWLNKFVKACLIADSNGYTGEGSDISISFQAFLALPGAGLKPQKSRFLISVPGIPDFYHAFRYIISYPRLNDYIIFVTGILSLGILEGIKIKSDFTNKKMK